jgi:hypothetical protein
MKDFIVALAESTAAAFTGGDPALSAKEIAQWYYGNPLVGPEAIKEVGKHLKKIILVMEAATQISYHPVSEYWFKRGDKPVTNVEEAKKCLPWGGGIKYAGIRIVPDDQDLLFKTWNELCGNSGAGVIHKTLDRVMRANGYNKISDDNAIDIADTLRRKMTPDSLTSLEKRIRGNSVKPKQMRLLE